MFVNKGLITFLEGLFFMIFLGKNMLFVPGPGPCCFTDFYWGDGTHTSTHPSEGVIQSLDATKVQLGERMSFIVALLLPWDCWLHWSMKVEGAEARYRVHTAVGKMETVPRGRGVRLQ